MYNNFKVLRDEAKLINIAKVKCILCGKSVDIKLSDDESLRLKEYFSGLIDIKEALPNHSADDREMFISGFCKECWDKEFPDE